MKKFLIIYHRDDNDGVFSAAIAEKYLTMNNESLIIERMPSDYVSLSKVRKDDIAEWPEKYASVIMTDISFSDAKMMKYLYNTLGNKLIWIDHHAPIIKASFTNGFSNANGERSTVRSAILLAFKFFFDPIDERYNTKKVPELFRMLSAWDSFTYENEGYELDYVRDVNKGVTEEFELIYGRVYGFVDNLINDWIKYVDTSVNFEAENNHFFFKGHTLNEYDDRLARRMIESYGDMSWTVNGESACALFVQQQTSSLMFKSITDKTRHGIVFKRIPDGKWGVSLYNTRENDKFHCGDYLRKKYNGGGHAGAAGCVLTESQFIELLSTKQL